MLRPRIIPCLLIKNNGLVKTVNFSSPKYVGDPINAVRIFNEKAVDELMILDIDATQQCSPPNYSMIQRVAAECQMPLCYGGGVATVEQTKRIIGLGVEKVAMSSAAISDPKVVRRIADEIGSQSIVVVLDVKNTICGKFEVYTCNGRKPTGCSPMELGQQFQEMGAGELIVNSIDNDGLMLGYDLELATKMRASVSIPLSILGGAGSLSDVKKLVETCGVVGAAAGSLFVYKGKFRAVLINYPDRQQKDDLFRLTIYSDQRSY